MNSISGFLGMTAVPGNGYWIAVCVAEFLVLWIGLVFLSHSLNFRFRERKEYLSGKTSSNRNSGTGVRTKSGARISAPFMVSSSTRSRRETKTPEAMPEETGVDRNSAERRASTLKQDAEQPHNGDIDVIVEDVEPKDGDDKSLKVETLRRSKDKAPATSEALTDKEQSEHESGAASSICRSPANRPMADEDRYNEGREGEERIHKQDEHENNEHVNIANVPIQNAEKNEQLQDEPSTPRADTNNRWSFQESDSGRTTRVSSYQPKSMDDPQSEERYDAAEENSRTGTPISRLNAVRRDGVTGRARHPTEGGHVFDMVQRLSGLGSDGLRD